MTSLALPGVVFAPRGEDDSDRQMTPSWLVEMVIELYNHIGTDPCWAEESHVCAGLTYDGSSPEQDGLAQPWRGPAWVNCPYSNPTPWADRCALHGTAGEQALLLVNVSTTVGWWRRWRPRVRAAAVAFFDRRISFIKGGVERKGNDREQMLVYWGPFAPEFTRIFQRCAWVP